MEFNGHLYLIKATKPNGTKFLKCSYHTRFFCKTSARIDPDGAFKLIKNHSHEVVPDNVRIFRNALKERAQNDFATKLRTIYIEEALRNEEGASDYGWPAAESLMRKARRTAVPAIPRTFQGLADLLLQHNFGEHYVCSGEKIFRRLILSDTCNSLIFSCQTLINDVLSRGVNEVHGDGTFKVVPRTPQAYQLFVLHVIIQNHSVPVLFAIMTSKSQEGYVDILRYFKEELAPTLTPEIIITDFERSLQNAFRSTYENVTVKGCFFHFSQAILKRCKREGYLRIMNEDINAKTVIKMVMALPLLPPNQIEYGILDIERESQHFGFDFDILFAYIRTYWIQTVGVNCLSVYASPRRTNNNLESFHSRLKEDIGVSHPGMWLFLKKIENLFKINHLTVNQINSGVPVTRGRKIRYIINDRIIKDATREFELQNITRLDFLRRCSRVTQNMEEQFRVWEMRDENNLANDIE